ncbi:hypothetical protein Cpir12675_005962 [Ceratocystis pirilliformis]|uniref:Meiosis-specific APC/C activator protein AMA1 n=1 Tax=Ceratocystis pirilliformis TaxID=259994 RepID=A0ABR3YLJ1_9PEZI
MPSGARKRRRADTHVTRSYSSDDNFGWKENAPSPILPPLLCSRNLSSRTRSTRSWTDSQTSSQTSPPPTSITAATATPLAPISNQTHETHGERLTEISKARLPSSSIPVIFFSPTIVKRNRRVASRQNLDRFITHRKLDSSLADRFQTTKSSLELTLYESLARSNVASVDPFISTPQQRNFALSQRSQALARNHERQLHQRSQRMGSGSIWNIGGAIPPINDGRGHLIQSGTSATRMYVTSWPGPDPGAIEESDMYSSRIAAALGLDRTERIFPIGNPDITEAEEGRRSDPRSIARNISSSTKWNGSRWVNDKTRPEKRNNSRTIPTAPFRVLDAPNLRNDFYCSLLSWCDTSQILAMGLGGKIYGWSENADIILLKDSGKNDEFEPWISALNFSSAEGRKSILAYSTSDGELGLIGIDDFRQKETQPRFSQRFEGRVSCLSWRPKVTWRPSLNPLLRRALVPNEDLLVGDERGCVSYYAVEWPSGTIERGVGFHGSVTLLARVFIHSQQVCGLAWSPDGSMFASGGNDNVCSLFEADHFLASRMDKLSVTPTAISRLSYLLNSHHTYIEDEPIDTLIPPIAEPLQTAEHQTRLPKHTWVHSAAVKAIAFCPWRPSVIATGGGSTDKCIHFFHTTSGTALATIAVSAQVTSLIWSTARREIVATFGFALPEHGRRIAVFSWPDCREVAALT